MTKTEKLFYELECQINNNCRGSALRTIEELKKVFQEHQEKTVPYGLREAEKENKFYENLY